MFHMSKHSARKSLETIPRLEDNQKTPLASFLLHETLLGSNLQEEQTKGAQTKQRALPFVS